MPEFQPAWDVVSASRWIGYEPALRLAAGGVMVLLAVVGIAFRDRLTGKLAEASKSTYLLLFIGLVWSGFHSYFIVESRAERNGLVSAYLDRDHEVVEGTVQVLHQQPRSGHDRGDTVKIDDRQFEINYYRKTAAYHTTLAHGGLLQDGVLARVSHIDGQIVAIEIAR